MTTVIRALLTVTLAALTAGPAGAYPLDGYPDSGIRRVEGARLANEGVIKDIKQPPGAMLPTAKVDLRLLGHRDMELPEPDPEFTRQVVGLLGDRERYGLAVLDLSDLSRPRYAEHRGTVQQNVGSVGKLVVALGVFQALADVWPDDPDRRTRVLKETEVVGDAFTHSDSHTIRIFDPERRALRRKVPSDGDRGSLWEWMDWMLSASSNAAAAMVQKEGMLLRHYGRDYPPPPEEAERFWRETPMAERTALYQQTFIDPVARTGLDPEGLRQGSLFTREGKRRVAGGGNSYGTARELVRYLLRMEQGRLVDEYSSRQIKRLLYMTERRIRYASSPALAESAVYFKSGSLYKCAPEPGFTCKKYHGNVKNYMNSVAIVESPAGDYRNFYLVGLVSNVLRKNSAVDHQTLATRLHRMIEKATQGP